MKLDLKYYPQHTDYSCGPVCLRMVFEHLGRIYSEEKLIALCKANKKEGTNHVPIKKEVEKEGFVYIEGTHGTIKYLINSIESGYPVIINYIDPVSESGHYAIVIGYDKKDKIIIIADPCNGNDFSISWNELKKRWHNQRNSSHGWFMIIGRESVNIK